MLVMISPVPFLFSLSFSFFLSPPLFFSLRSGFFFSLSLPFPLLTPGCWGEGAREGRRGVVWMPGVLSGVWWGEVGEVGILKKKIPCGFRRLRVRGSGRAEGWGP